MLRVSFLRVVPGKEARLRAWLAELESRAEEVRATFVDEAVRHEQAFILQTVDGPVLVWAAEADDFDQGRAAFANSRHPIDEQHKRVLKECLDGGLEIGPSYDVMRDEEEG